MKKLITLLLLSLSLSIYSQVTTVVTDDKGNQTNVFYDELGIITVSLQEKITQIEIDFDGGEKDSDDIILKYHIIQGPTLMWNPDVNSYNIVFTLKHKGSNPVGGLIDLHTQSLMLFYSDGSTLLYMGKGVIINLGI